MALTEAIICIDDREPSRVQYSIDIIVAHDPDEHTGGVPPVPVDDLPGVLERLPGNLHEEPMLGIHADRFPGRDPEEARVKLIDTRQEPPAARVDLADGLRVRVIHRGAPTIRRYLTGRVDA